MTTYSLVGVAGVTRCYHFSCTDDCLWPWEVLRLWQ